MHETLKGEIYKYIYIYFAFERECVCVCAGARVNYLRKIKGVIYEICYIFIHLVPFEVISSGCKALVVPFKQLVESPMEVLLCERVNDLRHSLFHLLNCLDYKEAEELS